MGLQKDIEFKGTGITLSYWRINSVTVDIELNVTRCRVGGYRSKADALAGKKAVENFKYEWIGAQNPIQLDTSPLDYRTLIQAKLIAEPAPFSPPNHLAGATIVSDLPE